MKELLVSLSLLCSLCLPATGTRRVLADDLLDMERISAARAAAEAQERATAAEMHKNFEAQIRAVEARREEVRKWTRTQFEVGERDIIDKPRVMPSLMRHWQAQREKEIYRLLQFPEKSGGGIESGRALNALLESLGPAAMENNARRKITPDEALPLTEPPELIRVDKALAEEITWQDNTLGAKSIGQGNRGVLDLDWPTILREERWNSYRARIDEGRKKALAEIFSSTAVSTEVDADLRTAVADLNTDFAAFRSDWVESDHPGVDRAAEYRRICDGARHIQKLVTGAYQLSELTPAQAAYRASFPGGSIEEYLAYLQRNNLRFAAAAPPHRSAYYKVFGMMVRYFLDEKMALNLERDLDGELSHLQRNDQHAIEAALGRTMNTSDLAATEIERLKTECSRLDKEAERRPTIQWNIGAGAAVGCQQEQQINMQQTGAPSAVPGVWLGTPRPNNYVPGVGPRH